MWGSKRGLRGSPREPPQAIVFTRPLHISFLNCVLAGTRQAWEPIKSAYTRHTRKQKIPMEVPWELDREI